MRCIYVALFKNWDDGMRLSRQEVLNEKFFKTWIALLHFDFAEYEM